MAALKNLHDYIAEIQERDNFKALTDDEQVRRRVVATISDIANSLK